MLDDVDDLPGGVRVVDLALIRHGPKLGESLQLGLKDRVGLEDYQADLDESSHDVLGYSGTVLPGREQRTEEKGQVQEAERVQEVGRAQRFRVY